MEQSLSNKLDHLFRHNYGSIVASLTSRYGSQYIDMIEDAVQESLFKAMRLWGFQELPNDPGAWLYRVASNALLDRFKKERNHRNYSFEKGELLINEVETPDARAIQDEQLQMIFACCSPRFSEKNSLLLSLKLIGGFSIREIGRALLLQEEAAKKAVQRAKKVFQYKMQGFVLPEGRELQVYLNRVIKVIYLMFTEGYKSSDGNRLVKEDLCGEALRLSLLLQKKESCDSSELLSLISLMCFKASRFNERINVNGDLVLLKDQDSSKYITDYINWGYYYYNLATSQHKWSSYYLEASIEFQYHIAKDYDSIDWEKVYEIHQRLQAEWPSTKGKLNMLIVKAKLYGAREVLEELINIEEELGNSHLYYAFKSDLHLELNECGKAVDCLKDALTLVQNEVEREYLRQKMEDLK